MSERRRERGREEEGGRERGERREVVNKKVLGLADGGIEKGK